MSTQEITQQGQPHVVGNNRIPIHFGAKDFGWLRTHTTCVETNQSVLPDTTWRMYTERLRVVPDTVA